MGSIFQLVRNLDLTGDVEIGVRIVRRNDLSRSDLLKDTAHLDHAIKVEHHAFARRQLYRGLNENHKILEGTLLIKVPAICHVLAKLGFMLL